MIIPDTRRTEVIRFANMWIAVWHESERTNTMRLALMDSWWLVGLLILSGAPIFHDEQDGAIGVEPRG